MLGEAGGPSIDRKEEEEEVVEKVVFLRVKLHPQPPVAPNTPAPSVTP